MAAIASSPAVLESEKQWAPQYLDHLKELFPQGRLEGRHFRIGNDGESGRRLAFNTEDGSWTDFGDDDNRGKGLFTFMGMIEGWDGIRRLSRQEFCNLDIPLYLDHTQARLHSAFDYAEKRGMEVVRRWEYNDSDGVLLGVRIRMEDKVSREKEFDDLSDSPCPRTSRKEDIHYGGLERRRWMGSHRPVLRRGSHRRRSYKADSSM